MRATAVLVLACLAGCTTREIRASPAELEAARKLLRDGQPAKVRSQEHGLVEVTPAQRVVIVDTANKKFDLGIAEIVRDCADHPADEHRLCELHGVQHVVIGKDRKVQREVYLVPISVIAVGLVVGGLIGVSYCAAECDNTIARRSSQATVGALAVGLLYVVFRNGRRR